MLCGMPDPLQPPSGPAAPDETPLAERLEATLPLLSARMASAARHMLAYPEDVAVFSLREIARRIGIPASTLSRLARRLGFAGYDVLRRAQVERVRRQASGGLGGVAAARNRDTARAVIDQAGTAEGAASFAATAFAAEEDVLRRTLAGLSIPAVEAAAALLAGARRVYVTGRRTAFGPAFALSYLLHKARPEVMLLPGQAGAPEAPLEDAGPGDVLVAVTFAPISRQTLALIEQAAAAGSRIIVISDVPVAALRRLAGRQLFVVAARGASFLEAIGGAVALGNLLVGLVIAQLGGAAEQRIARNEQRLVASGEYLLAGRVRSRRGR
jgi:DNA-binding MurR/RpiR family transcriptional regulator